MNEEQDVMDKFDELRNNFTTDQLIELEAAIDFYYEMEMEYHKAVCIHNIKHKECLIAIDQLMNSFL